MSELLSLLAPRSPDEQRLRITVEATCYKCPDHRGATIRHTVDVMPTGFGNAAFEWALKHPGHDIEFLSLKRSFPRRFADWMYQHWGIDPWFLTAKENDNLKLEYGAVTTVTITLASLASSSTYLVGQQSTSVVNTTDKLVDYQFTAKITTGTTPTVDTEIRLYGIRPVQDDTPTWPDAFGATDAARTVTNANILNQLAFLQGTRVTASSNVGYPLVRQQTWAESYGWVQKNMVIFVSHANGAALHATAGNHLVYGQGIYFTSLS